MKRKAFGLILRQQHGQAQLLAMHVPGAKGLRLPGGGLNKKESPKQALRREIWEEAGLDDLHLIRKLGVHIYYKRSSSTLLERHDYLLQITDALPDQWTHQVTGKGADAGEVFRYRWLYAHETDLIAAELRTFITPQHIPELFGF